KSFSSLYQFLIISDEVRSSSPNPSVYISLAFLTNSKPLKLLKYLMSANISVSQYPSSYCNSIMLIFMCTTPYLLYIHYTTNQNHCQVFFKINLKIFLNSLLTCDTSISYQYHVVKCYFRLF